MGVDYLSCISCGDAFPDCGRFVRCDCGNDWCSDKCADDDGFCRDEEDNRSCNYCREEDFEDGELLAFVISRLGLDRQTIIEEYKEHKTKGNDSE